MITPPPTTVGASGISSKNTQAAAASNGGAAPPDFSLLAKARVVERGFPTFVFDVFTQYAEGGPDYVYSLLTGYDHEPPEGMEIPEGTYYNPYFIAGKSLAMAPPLSDDVVTYDDDSRQFTVHSMGDNGSDGDEDDVFSDGLRKDQESDY